MNITNKTPNPTPTNKRREKGVWTKPEHAKMIEFLHEHKDRIEENVLNIITNKYRSNKSHFFQLMADHIKTKSIKQCKSRYQKKEMEMLNTIGIPYSTIKSYFLFRKLKSPFNRQKQLKAQNNDSNGQSSESNSQTSDSNSITDANELKRVLMSEILPRVVNPSVKGDIQIFIEHLVSRENLDRFVPLVDINEIRKVLNKHGIFQLQNKKEETG